MQIENSSFVKELDCRTRNTLSHLFPPSQTLKPNINLQSDFLQCCMFSCCSLTCPQFAALLWLETAIWTSTAAATNHNHHLNQISTKSSGKSIPRIVPFIRSHE
eukprot:Sdes_comp9606_c0_seq1m1092